MTNICSRAGFFVFFLFVSLSLFAFPDQEKAVSTVFDSQATSMILDEDRFLMVSFGDDILRIDTETFALATDQVPVLIDNSDDGGADLTGNVVGLAIRGDTLFASQSDGDFLTIDLSDITAEPVSTNVIDGTLGPLVVDTEGGPDDDKLYILDKTNNAVIIRDIGDGTDTVINLVDDLGAVIAPVSLVFVPFPTASSSSATDKVYVTANSGLVFVINEGGSAVAATISLGTNKELPALAATPEGNFLLVVNRTDNVVHVIDTATDAEIDADPGVVGTDPISLPQNGALQSVVVTDVTDPGDTYAYVTGSEGISVIDLNIGTTGFSEPTVLDFNDGGSGDDDDDPLVLDSDPGLIVASSAADGYVYTSNGNATISIVTDNPFVTIAGGTTSLGDTALTTGGSFTVTFQSDETGTYRVLVGGDRTANGTEAATGTVDAVDTDVTTASIGFDAGLFEEGTNRIFVFVTDAQGNRGRAAVDITVDTPPPQVEIVGTSFGNEKIFVEFNRLTVADMDRYNIYVDTDPSVLATRTDPNGTLAQPSSGNTVEADVAGLTNGVTYFIAVEGVDQTGNIGLKGTTLPGGTPATATPEVTIGLADATGETGCGLVRTEGRGLRTESFVILLTGIVSLVLFRRRMKVSFFLVVLLLSTQSSALIAKELTPQWWSLEFKGGAWMPMNGTTKDFLGSCCGPTGAVEFGFLYKSKFGVEVGVGYIGEGGRAVGAASGAVSRDKFDFTMIPIQNSFTFRADFKEDQLLVPYAKFGLDYLIFRENIQGDVTKGVKLGLHAAGGLQILLDKIEDLSTTLESSLGVNDVYFTLEGRYAWVDGFGGSGVDLSNLTFSGGFLFEF